MAPEYVAMPVDLLEKQERFLLSEHPYVLYSGAWGAGKSRALCHKVVARAMTPGARELIVRKHLVTLRKSTLRTLLEPDGDLPAVLNPDWIASHNKTDCQIILETGGEIDYGGLDSTDKIGSTWYSGIAIDEAIETNEDEWNALRGRRRLQVPNLPLQTYAATNPGSPSHYLFARFGIGGGHIAQPDYELIQTSTLDNYFLPPDYVDDLKTMQGMAYKRYVLGQWVGSDKLVYDTWDRDKFVRECPPYEWLGYRRIVIGCDEGYTNPAVFLVAGVDADGRIYLMSEWYKTKQLPEDVVRKGKAIYARFDHNGLKLPPPERFIVDPSAAGLIASLRAAGLPVTEADNEVMAGVQRVRDMLVLGGDGKPRLQVDPSCVNTIREFETYENKEDKDEPKKENDHAMDALKYLTAFLTKGGWDGTTPWGESVKSAAKASKQFHAQDVTTERDPIGGSVEFREQNRDED